MDSPILSLLKQNENDMKIFTVMRNSDMTEGRGPMVLVDVYTDYDAAFAYIQGQAGIMGTTQAAVKAAYSSDKCHSFNGFDILISETNDSTADEIVASRPKIPKLYKTVYVVTVLSVDERPTDLTQALREADHGEYSQDTSSHTTKINRGEFITLCHDQGTNPEDFFGE